MTDRELLELAAKAAGYDCRWEGDGDFINLEDGLPWNPLTDDGDALRLAVKLGITIMFDRSSVWCEQYGDPFAATRRAIVRAAVACSALRRKGMAMKLSELIEQAQNAIETYGDLDVFVPCPEQWCASVAP